MHYKKNGLYLYGTSKWTIDIDDFTANLQKDPQRRWWRTGFIVVGKWTWLSEFKS